MMKESIVLPQGDSLQVNQKKSWQYLERNPTLDLYLDAYDSVNSPKRLVAFFHVMLEDMSIKFLQFMKYANINIENGYVLQRLLLNIHQGLYGDIDIGAKDVCRDIDTVLFLINQKNSPNESIRSILLGVSESHGLPHFQLNIVKGDRGVGFKDMKDLFEETFRDTIEESRKSVESKIFKKREQEEIHQKEEAREKEKVFFDEIRNTGKACVTEDLPSNIIQEVLDEMSNITVDVSQASQWQKRSVRKITKNNTIVDNYNGVVSYPNITEIENGGLKFGETTDVTNIGNGTFNLKLDNSFIGFSGNVNTGISFGRLQVLDTSMFYFKNPCRVGAKEIKGRHSGSGIKIYISNDSASVEFVNESNGERIKPKIK